MALKYPLSWKKCVGALGLFWTLFSSLKVLVLDSILQTIMYMYLEPFFNPYPPLPLPNNDERYNNEVDNMTPINIVQGGEGIKFKNCH